MKGVLLAGGTGSRLFPLTKITNSTPPHLRPPHGPVGHRGGGASRDHRAHAGHRRHARRRIPAPAGQRPRVRHRPAHLRLPGAARGDRRGPGPGRAVRGGEPVLVMLADNVVERSHPAHGRGVRADPRGAHPVLTESRRPAPAPSRGPRARRVGRLVSMVEKPEDPAVQLRGDGIYCYDAGVFEVIKTLEPSGRGELEITDVNNHYVSEGRLAYDVLEGFWGAPASRSTPTTPSTTSSGLGANKVLRRAQPGSAAGRGGRPGALGRQGARGREAAIPGASSAELGQDLVRLALGDEARARRGTRARERVVASRPRPGRRPGTSGPALAHPVLGGHDQRVWRGRRPAWRGRAG